MCDLKQLIGYDAGDLARLVNKGAPKYDNDDSGHFQMYSWVLRKPTAVATSLGPRSSGFKEASKVDSEVFYRKAATRLVKAIKRPYQINKT